MVNVGLLAELVSGMRAANGSNRCKAAGLTDIQVEVLCHLPCLRGNVRVDCKLYSEALGLTIRKLANSISHL